MNKLSLPMAVDSYNYAHTSTPKAASSHRYTAAKKNDKPTAAAPVAHTRDLSSSAAATLHGKTQGFVLRLPPQNIAHATSCSHDNGVRSINSQTCTCLRTEQHQNTKWQQSCSHSNAICNRRFLNTLELRTHKHTQSSFKPPLHCGKKKRQTDRSRTRRTHEVPFIVACSHFTRKNTRFRAPASSPKHSPCNIMQPLQCGSQHQLANLHMSTHRTTPEHQMTTVMQPFQCDLPPEIPKHPITTHTQAHPKQLQATVTLRQKKRQTDRSRTRRTHEVPFIVGCSHFTRKNTRFRAPASSPKHSPCNIMQPLQCGSQHQLANLHVSTHRTTPEHQMTTVMQPFQCDLPPEIPKHPITTHTHKHTQSSFKPPLHCGKKNDKPTAAAPVAHTRYLSSSPAATLHGKKKGFVLRLPPQNIAHATSCSHDNGVRSINSQTCTCLRTEQQHQNTRWQQSCSHSNAICHRRFQNTL